MAQIQYFQTIHVLLIIFVLTRIRNGHILGHTMRSVMRG